MIMVLVLLASAAETMPWSVAQVSSQLVLCFLILPLTALLCAATVPQWRNKILLGGGILFLTILPATLLHARNTITLTLHVIAPRDTPPLLICTHPAYKAVVWATSEQVLTANRQNITTLLRPSLNKCFNTLHPGTLHASTPPAKTPLPATHYEIAFTTNRWTVVVADSLLLLVNKRHPHCSLTTAITHPSLALRLPPHAPPYLLSQQPAYFPFATASR
jgi:hypothetical protein